LINFLKKILQFLSFGFYTAESSDKPKQQPANSNASANGAQKPQAPIAPIKNTEGNTTAKQDKSKQNESLKPAQSTSHSKAAAKSAKPQAWSVDQFQVPPVAGKTRFHDFDIAIEIMHAIADLQFEYCSDIQAQVLPHTLAGLDMIGKAQTGTGKTAAFLVSVINHLVENPVDERYSGEPRALVLAPTRELALQIAKDAQALTKYLDFTVVSIVGGMDYEKQLTKLHHGYIDIMVATPGRLIDFINKKEVFLEQVEVLVLDEADRMLDMGFIPDVRRIIRHTPKKEYRQTLLFSATFTDAVMELAEQWTLEPVSISIEPEHVATDTVDQRVYIVTAEKKYNLLYNMIMKENLEKLIIFANRRDETRDLQERLKKDGITCALLSGEVPQAKRVRTLDNFKQGNVKVLVATDVAGRGIHIDGISHVVNYSLPEDPEDYVHRIGRTGRAGNTGISVSFACEDDSFQIPVIEELLGNKLNCVYPDADLLTHHQAKA